MHGPPEPAQTPARISSQYGVDASVEVNASRSVVMVSPAKVTATTVGAASMPPPPYATEGSDCLPGPDDDDDDPQATRPAVTNGSAKAKRRGMKRKGWK